MKELTNKIALILVKTISMYRIAMHKILLKIYAKFPLLQKKNKYVTLIPITLTYGVGIILSINYLAISCLNTYL